MKRNGVNKPFDIQEHFAEQAKWDRRMFAILNNQPRERNEPIRKVSFPLKSAVARAVATV